MPHNLIYPLSVASVPQRYPTYLQVTHLHTFIYFPADFDLIFQFTPFILARIDFPPLQGSRVVLGSSYSLYFFRKIRNCLLPRPFQCLLSNVYVSSSTGGAAQYLGRTFNQQGVCRAGNGGLGPA